jgi:hypothetical protein
MPDPLRSFVVKERIEHLSLYVDRNSAAVIVDRYAHALAFSSMNRSEADRDFCFRRSCFRGIPHQVAEDLA